MKLLMLLEKFIKKLSVVTCPFCHDVIEGRKWTCPKCGAGYHMDCLGSSGRCVNTGCTGRISPVSYGVKPEIKEQIKKGIQAGMTVPELIKRYGEAAYLDAARELG